MGVFQDAAGYERVVFATDPRAGLRCIVAIHSTRLGPALGGCRIRPYPDEDRALRDVLGLARSMTWKAAAAGLDLGGGKAVIIADPQRDKTEPLLRSFGRVVESLGGRYITSVDVGTGTADLDEMRRETRWAVGVSPFLGGGGDPSPITARGVAVGIRSCLYHVGRDSSLHGRRVAVQGAGKVGYHLASILSAAGAEVVVSDIDLDNVGRTVSDHCVKTCSPEDILELDCDVLAPCALGGVLDERTIPKLGCRIVCGAANNQLDTPAHGRALAVATGLKLAQPDKKYLVVVGDGKGMVGVVPGLGRQVERDRQAGLAVLEQILVAGVRLCGGAEARVLTDRPQPPPVHGRVDAAGERKHARIAEVALVVHHHVVGRAERLVLDPRDGREERVALRCCLVQLLAPRRGARDPRARLPSGRHGRILGAERQAADVP